MSIVSVKDVGEDYPAIIECKSVYDDMDHRRENTFVVTVEENKIVVIHTAGDLTISENGTIDEYLKGEIKICRNIFKAMFPGWKE